MRKVVSLIFLLFSLCFISSCMSENRKESEKSTTMSTTDDFWERMEEARKEGRINKDLTINGTPSMNSREKEIVETLTVPAELTKIAEQKFEHYLLPEELVVEKRTYRNAKGAEQYIVVELIDELKTFDTLTAFLNEEGQIQRYKFRGDTPTYLYDFINYMEENQTISDEIWAKQSASDSARDEQHPSMFQKAFYGKQLVYDVAYDFQKTGTERFIAEITFIE